MKKEIAGLDAYHSEKHWLFNGGRIGRETELPSAKVLVTRSIAKLREVRTMCLSTAPQTAKYQNQAEYRRDLYRRENLDGDSDSEDEVESYRKVAPVKEDRCSKKARVDCVEDKENRHVPITSFEPRLEQHYPLHQHVRPS